MSEILNQLNQIVQGIIGSLGYPGIFLLMLLENLFPPFPSEIIMPFSGFLVSADRFNLPFVLTAGTLGAVAGALLIYWAGRHLNRDGVYRWVRRYGRYLLLSEQDLDRSLHFFERHGKLAILIGRLVPGFRSLISLPAGLERMDIPIFIVFTLLGSLAWNTLLTLAGVVLGQNWHIILDWIDTYELVLWILLGLLIAFLVYRRLRSRKQQSA